MDAAILARYGHDRYADLPLCEMSDESLALLTLLVTRRAELAVYAKEEKQRLSARLDKTMQCLIGRHLDYLEGEIQAIEKDIVDCIAANPLLCQKAALMQTLPGIGPQTSAFLLAEMTELSRLDRKEIAAIAGLAPHAYESGKMVGIRTTCGGWAHVKRMLPLTVHGRKTAP